ncbi:trypsin-like serine protease [Streptomyces sp. NPDC048417]|uniref:trypsin-like serine protease n=1 Tax=Streptomyces sp. NPDC048417 TaxID=3155387 RepID=UPI003424C120
MPDTAATRNTCTGDSGSPVLAVGASAAVVGLVSWGPSCPIGDAGVYVRVASLRNRIGSAHGLQVLSASVMKSGGCRLVGRLGAARAGRVQGREAAVGRVSVSAVSAVHG